MKMDKLTTGVAYGASAGSVLNGLLNTFSPDQWNALGVIAGVFIAILTFIVNVYFKVKEDRRNSAALRGE